MIVAICMGKAFMGATHTAKPLILFAVTLLGGGHIDGVERIGPLGDVFVVGATSQYCLLIHWLVPFLLRLRNAKTSSEKILFQV